jgi:uncharacterized protein YoxC
MIIAATITLAALVVLLAINLNRSDRRIDHLEGRVALLLSAFTTETTVNEDGDVVETITPKVSA